MLEDPVHTALLCTAAFAASIFGIVIGGHSFVTVPLMNFFGMPPVQAVATNRFATLFLSLVGLRNYHRFGKLDIYFSLPFALAAVLGSVAGSLVVEPQSAIDYSRPFVRGKTRFAAQTMC